MKILVAGSKGMVGRAIVRQLKKKKKFEIIEATRENLNFLIQEEVSNFFSEKQPDIVIIAAAKVGGIQANSNFPAEFIYENLMIECNLIHESFKNNVKKLLFLGSSCIYPLNSPQPMKESHLLSGKLEPSNAAYAIAKIAGINLCSSYNKQYDTDFRSIMPTNLYGPFDNFDFENSHVIPGLIAKIHRAKINNEEKVTVWGTGKPLREFLHVDDLAEASIFALELDKSVYKENVSENFSHINIGSGKEISISDLSKLLCKIIGYKGTLEFDYSKPDGNPRKLLDNTILKNLGWNSRIELEEGLKQTYDWFVSNQD